MSKRLVKVARDLNRSIKELVEVLNKFGFTLPLKPTTIITEEMEAILHKEIKKMLPSIRNPD
jgi:hypothetical protein